MEILTKFAPRCRPFCKLEIHLILLSDSWAQLQWCLFVRDFGNCLVCRLVRSVTVRRTTGLGM